MSRIGDSKASQSLYNPNTPFNKTVDRAGEEFKAAKENLKDGRIGKAIVDTAQGTGQSFKAVVQGADEIGHALDDGLHDAFSAAKAAPKAIIEGFKSLPEQLRESRKFQDSLPKTELSKDLYGGG